MPSGKVAQNGKVTYVVDEGLVRFGKFAAAVLGVFILVGTYLFGIKLEVTVEKMRTAQRELEKSQKDLEEQRKRSSEVQKRLTDAESTAAKLLEEIEKNRQTSWTIVEELQAYHSLNTVERDRILTLKQETPASFRGTSRLWPIGATLKVRFLDGTPEQKSKFRQALGEWLQYANLHVAYSEDADTQIGVSFSQSGSWSFIGTDALAVKGMATINLNDADMPTFLHVIGQMLGLVKEWWNPKANIPWDRPRVYAELQGPPNNWTKETIDANVFARGAYPGSREFDPKSIMMFAIPDDWVTDRKGFSKPTTLSESDKKYISQLYPR